MTDNPTISRLIDDMERYFGEATEDEGRTVGLETTSIKLTPIGPDSAKSPLLEFVVE